MTGIPDYPQMDPANDRGSSYEGYGYALRTECKCCVCNDTMRWKKITLTEMASFG